MNRCARVVVLAMFALTPFLVGSASAAVLLHANFEPPTYSLGYVHGQDGWNAIAASPHQVTNTIVHGGTQSLNGVADSKEFTGVFSHHSPAWYMETWCYTQPMPGSFASRFSARSVLSDAFWIELRGDGQLTFYSASTTSVRTLGATALNKWLHWKVEQIAPLTIRMSVTGVGVNESWITGYLLQGEPSEIYVGVSPPSNLADSAPYWDDILVVDDPATPTLPESWGALKGRYR